LLPLLLLRCLQQRLKAMKPWDDSAKCVLIAGGLCEVVGEVCSISQLARRPVAPSLPSLQRHDCERMPTSELRPQRHPTAQNPQKPHFVEM
jgi:hypothetical protein